MYRVTYIGCANGVVTRSATEQATAMEATGPATVPLELSLRQPTQKKISNFRPISTTVDLDSANFKIGQTTHVHSLKYIRPLALSVQRETKGKKVVARSA
jgi:hypothetical protein